VSFEVPRGVVLGVCGHNGSGKSTMLKVLAGVLAPTEGSAELYGRVSPLLSLGVGFNPMLNGRDNIIRGGLCAGFTVDEIKAKVADVIEFSELGDAIDRQVRTYSNGMHSRLGFAVAAMLEPEIVLIDEVLAAGDAAFMLKSAQRIRDMTETDTTVVLVSHTLGVLRSLSDTCIWMDAGSIAMAGDPAEVIATYMKSQGLDPSKIDQLDAHVGEWAATLRSE
jgi:ABC-type polysaccharide/polyol phosphate transport system ATPase subunit